MKDLSEREKLFGTALALYLAAPVEDPRLLELLLQVVEHLATKYGIADADLREIAEGAAWHAAIAGISVPQERLAPLQ